MAGNILVTGGCGYIGSHICLNLSSKGHQLVVLDNLNTGTSELLLHDEKFILGSCDDEVLVKRCIRDFKVDTVIHAAASVVVPESVLNPSKYYNNNLLATYKLLKVCAENQVKNFILSSTAAIYGSQAKSPLTETAPLDPMSPYGRSKLAAEWLLMDIAPTANMAYTILRYFNVAGCESSRRLARRSPKSTHLLRAACQFVLGKRQKLEIFGNDYPTSDGTGVRDYVHVEDVAEVHSCAIDYLKQKQAREVFNCGLGQGYTVAEVLRSLERISAQKVDYIKSPRRPGDIAEIYANSSKAKTMLNWQPKYPQLDDIVRSAYLAEKASYA